MSSNKVKVKISVLNGKVNQPQDSNGLADPYVRIGKINSEDNTTKWFLKTPAQSKTLSPVWNYEESGLVLNLSKYKALKVQLFDKDLLSKDDFIGENEIDIQNINKKDITETQSLYHNSDKSNPVGNVWILIQKEK